MVFEKTTTAPTKGITRTQLTVRGLLGAADHAPISVKTINLSTQGACVKHEDFPFPAGTACCLRINVLVDGDVEQLDLPAQVSFSVHSQGIYRTDLAIAALDNATRMTLDKALRGRPLMLVA